MCVNCAGVAIDHWMAPRRMAQRGQLMNIMWRLTLDWGPSSIKAMAKTQARVYAGLRRRAPTATEHEILVQLYLSRVRAAAQWGKDGHGVYTEVPAVAESYVEGCGDLFGLVMGMVMAEWPQLGLLVRLRPIHAEEVGLTILRALDAGAPGWAQGEATKQLRSDLGV